ncbi:MAG: helix-turn-helix transcriptional regulator [Lachnospiraceae bacterium]|nr:helix-turn-helix transcriptional regulator [Lachnospiraceae bacterium]
MSGKRKEQIEFRYYEMPENLPILALMGDSWKMEYGKDTPGLHFHNFMEIGYCHYGAGTMTVENDEIRFEPDTFTIIPKNVPHKTLSDKGDVGFWEYLFVDVDSFVKEIYQDNAAFARTLIKRINSQVHFIDADRNPGLAEPVKQLFQEMSEKKEFYREKCRGILQVLLLEIARNSREKQPANDRNVRKQTSEPENHHVQITAALHYIEAHYAEELKIRKLADVCHMSETHFRRVFHEIMNMTPSQYVNLVRIEAACELMQRSDLSMTRISEQTGFGATSTFNRNFKEMTGMSPYQWKRNPEKLTGRNKYRISALRGWY